MKERTSVLYVSHSSALYGAPRILLDLVTKLDRAQFHPIVAVSEQGPLVDELKRLDIEVCVLRPIESPVHTSNLAVRLVVNARRAISDVWLACRLMALLKRRRIDLVHVNSTATRYPLLAGRVLSIPVVSHAREIIEDKTKRILITRLMQLCSTKILVMSDGVRDMFRGLKCYDDVTVFYDGIDLHTWSLDHINGRRVREQLGVRPGETLVGIVGQIIPRKGIESFILAAKEVLERIEGVRFLVVGDAPPYYQQYMLEMQDLVAKEDLSGKVSFTGYRTDVRDIIGALDVLVLASTNEPFGLVLLEAMALERPVVATNVGGVPEIVLDGLTGHLVPPDDYHQLAEAVLDLVADPEKRARMGQRGRQRVEQMFDSNVATRNIMALYRTLVRGQA
jgi:glycosyltransferase involved in cell wall biosynthesis